MRTVYIHGGRRILANRAVMRDEIAREARYSWNITRYGVMGRKGGDHREVWGNGEEVKRA